MQPLIKLSRNILFSSRGFSIVGSLVAFTLLGVSGAGLMHYTSSVRKTSQGTVEKLEYRPILKTKIIHGMKALLIEKNVDQNGKVATGGNVNTYGICSLIEAPSELRGVDTIKLNLFNIQNRVSWSKKRWQYFFPSSEWEFVSNECVKIDSTFSNSNLSRCLRYRGDTGSESEVVYAIAQIIPKAFPQFNTVDISQQSESVLDPKKVIFYLSTKLLGVDSVDKGAATYMSSSSDVVWSNEVGECNVDVGGEKTIVKFSGTGVGTTFGKSVFNTTVFDGQAHQRSRFDILNINDNIVQASRVQNFKLSFIPNLNVKVSCVRNKFKCKQNISANPPTDYDDLQFIFNVMNHTPGPISIKAINVTLKKSDNTEWDGREDGKLNTGTLSLYHSSDDGSVIEGNQSIQFDIPSGSSNFSAFNDIDSVCHNICKNYKPNQQSTYVYPFINIHEDQNNGMIFEKDYSNDVSNRVRCTVCHMKACHRYRLGTFGPYREEKSVVSTQNQQGVQRTLYGLADEPLDGQVPECSVKYEYNNMRELHPAVTNLHYSSGKCIAMKNVSSISSFKDFRNSQYEAVDCNTPLPVLCFVNGHYYPAMRLTNNPNAPTALVSADFQGAQEACFQMGREIGRYDDLEMLFFNNLYNMFVRQAFGTSMMSKISITVRALPSFGRVSTTNFGIGRISATNSGRVIITGPQSDKFDFVNNVSRGMFFTPPSHNFSFIPVKVQEVIRKFINRGHTKIWTAMEWDAGGATMASPPWALVAKDQPFSIYFDKDVGRPLIFLQDDSSGSFGARPDLALSYNIRWKGLVPQRGNNDLPFVCQKKNTKRFFITRHNTGKANEGVDKCKLEGGKFVPPESSMDWAKVMLLLNPNDIEFPYPDPKGTPALIPGLDRSERTDHYTAAAQNPMSYVSYLNTKVVDNPKAWVALKHISGTDSKQAPLAKDLRLSRSWPSNSIFLKPDRNAAVSALQGDKYMTSKGVPKSLSLPDLATVSANTPKITTPYYKLCFRQDKSLFLKLLDQSCSNVVDLTLPDAFFEPLGIQYMTKWDDIPSGKKIVLYKVDDVKTQIKNINDKIDQLIQQPQQQQP